MDFSFSTQSDSMMDYSSRIGCAVAKTPANSSEFDDILFRLIDGNKVGDIWVQHNGMIFYRENANVLPVLGISTDELKQSVIDEWFSRVLGDNNVEYAVDTSYTITRGSISRRFRVNAYRSLGQLRVCFRLVADNITEPEELRVPDMLINEFCNYNDGLVLVCGATGSGKSTTIASLLAKRARQRREHIITLEDPIEYLFKNSQAFFSQRERGTDFSDYPQAIKHALRESPDTILIGEIRDCETAEAALQAAETGHLVVSTMHTKRASDALERFMLLFPQTDSQRVLSMLASVMRFVLCQRLVPDVRGNRVALFEPMLVNEQSNLQPVIRRGDKLAVSLRNTMEITNYIHNYTFLKDLNNLKKAGSISGDTYATLLHEFESANT